MPIPTQLRNFSIKANESIDINVGWLIKGVRVDNNTSVWYILQPQGYVIPPSTLAWTTDLPQASSAVNIAPTTYSNQPNFVFTGDTVKVTVYSEMIGVSGGFAAIPNDQRASTFSAAPGATLSTGTLSFPAIGCRVDNTTGTWYQIGATGILVPPWTSGFTIDILPAVVAVTLTPATAPYPPANASTGSGIVLTLYASKIGNYGGTTGAVGVASAAIVQSNYNISSSNTFNTVFGVGATAGSLLVGVATSITQLASSITTTPTGFTTVLSAGGNASYWCGYKIAAGGETTFDFVSSSAPPQGFASLVAEYRGYTNGLYSNAATANTASVSGSLVVSPQLLICLSGYATSAASAAGATSPDVILRLMQYGTPLANRYVGVAIGDLTYSTTGNHSGTISWAGGNSLITYVNVGG